MFSTALQEGWLMVQCVECGLHGTVNDPTKEEWAGSFPLTILSHIAGRTVPV